MTFTRFSLRDLALAVTCLSLCACASTQELDMVVGESPRGAVYLERIQDRSFQAAHPIRIDQETVARVLRGILVKENQGLLRTLMAGQSAVAPAFTEEEARYLAPLITEGFSRAAPDQQIGFRLIQSGSGFSQAVGAGVGSSEPSSGLSLTETSRGSIYAYGRSVYLTLAEYHVRSERADTINMANRRVPDSTGLANRTLSFSPESAKRPDTYRSKHSTENTIIIDYELLATLPGVTPATSTSPSTLQPELASPSMSPDQPAGTDAQLRVLEEQMRQKDKELEELRKDLRDIRRQLNDPPAGSGKPQSK